MFSVERSLDRTAPNWIVMPGKLLFMPEWTTQKGREIERAGQEKKISFLFDSKTKRLDDSENSVTCTPPSGNILACPRAKISAKLPYVLKGKCSKLLKKRGGGGGGRCEQQKWTLQVLLLTLLFMAHVTNDTCRRQLSSKRHTSHTTVKRGK